VLEAGTDRDAGEAVKLSAATVHGQGKGERNPVAGIMDLDSNRSPNSGFRGMHQIP